MNDLDGEARVSLAEVAPLPAVAAGLERIARAMAARPEWVSGENTGLTRLAREFPGQLVVKNGAEGMLCVAWPLRDAGLALKVADGNARAALPALLFLLLEFEWLPAEVAARLQDVREPVLHGYRGQEVGRVRVRCAG